MKIMFSSSLEHEIRSVFKASNCLDIRSNGIIETYEANLTINTGSCILAQQYSIRSTAELRLSINILNEVKSCTPNFRRSPSKCILTYLDILTLCKGLTKVLNLARIEPLIAVVVIPDQVCQGKVEGRHRDSIDPQPVVSKGVAIENIIIRLKWLYNDYIPSRVPECVQTSRDIVVDVAVYFSQDGLIHVATAFPVPL